MGITAEQAAEIAHRHGLDLADAASLRALADDEATADKIAARFAAPDAQMRRFTRGLFTTDEPQTPLERRFSGQPDTTETSAS